MEDDTSFEWTRFRTAIQQALVTLPHFLKHPIDGMRQMPDWDWPTLLTLQGGFALICGVMMDLAERHYLSAVASIFIAPIVAIAANAITSGFFYYTFLFYFRTRVEYRPIFTHLLFASIPVLLMSILRPFVPLVGLVGLAAAGILLLVGFTVNFRLPMKPLRNLLFVIFLVYAASLIFQMFRYEGGRESLRVRATPESLDILEKELKEQSN
jgi:hypothetical protein